jgi:hypothetical protein
MSDTTNSQTSWTVPIIEFEGDLAVEFPDELMEAAGWKVGDVMTWIDNKDGTWTIVKKDVK